MTFQKLLLAGAVAASAIASTSAHADLLNNSFVIDVTSGSTNGGFDALPGAAPFIGNTATASFTYNGPLNFSNTAVQNTSPAGDLNSSFFTPSAISSYSGNGSFAGGSYGTLGDFLKASGSAGTFAYGSFYTIDLGTVAAGTILTITHDDGVSLFENNARLGNTVAGATSVVTDTVDVTTTGDVMLYYSRQNGTPSILQVSAVPEASTWAMMILGFCGVGFVAYRKRETSLRLV